MNTIHWKSDALAAFDAAGDWIGGAGPSTDPDAIPFNAGGGVDTAASVAGVDKSKTPKLTTLASFNGSDGADPFGSLITDAAGDLFGTTNGGGANPSGTVFEIAKTKSGYASTPISLITFTGADGAYPAASLIADAAGDLFGTTQDGGADGDGTVFEIAKTKSGYTSAPTTLISFTGANGAAPYGSLTADAAGDLFGTTYQGGADNDGTVFEIAKTRNGYASAPTTLVSFTGSDGYHPDGSLIADAAGDLFGTTIDGGTNGDGTVFELARTKGGYASAPTILVSFTGADGASPYGDLIADAAGNLFGTTYQGGADNDGVVFEIAKTKNGYASAPTTLVTFTGPNGEEPFGSLIADAAGDLLGTTSAGGADAYGTVFEITNSGFVPPAMPVTPATHGAHSSPPGAAFVQAMASFGPSGSGDTTPAFLASRHDTSMHLSRPHVAY